VGSCPLFVFGVIVERLDDVRAFAERVAGTYGLEIFDVQFRREASGWVLRVTIDRPGLADTQAKPGAPADSVGVDDCRHVSHDLSALLDVEEPIERVHPRGDVARPGSPAAPRRRLRPLSRSAGPGGDG
jgi:ribosome maturation factor RimP